MSRSDDSSSAPTSATLTTEPEERYPGELQALVDYWAKDAGLSPSEARKHAVDYLRQRRASERLFDGDSS